MSFDLNFYKGKKVLITGHTGFKGTWMCKVLEMAGADVVGYALEPPTSPSLFEILGFGDTIKDSVNSISENIFSDKGSIQTIIGDVRDLQQLSAVFDRFQPEIVIHMAAQPIVLASYRDPVGTYDINVMGTVNILECVRSHPSVKSFVNVTTDKVYLNREWERGYVESDELNGYDPYSNSKSCSELVTSSYRNSFFGGDTGMRRDGSGYVAITTMRAGNVIGGGDFASNRIIPDCIRAVESGETILVRNPYSTRPYQHVLEPVMAYLMIAAKQYEDISLACNYNVGPNDDGCYTTGNIVDLFCNSWNKMADNSNNSFNKASWENKSELNAPHEANFLKLDCAKIKSTFGWNPRWNLETAMEKIVEWSELYLCNKSDINKISGCMINQINKYLS